MLCCYGLLYPTVVSELWIYFRMCIGHLNCMDDTLFCILCCSQASCMADASIGFSCRLEKPIAWRMQFFCCFDFSLSLEIFVFGFFGWSICLDHLFVMIWDSRSIQNIDSNLDNGFEFLFHDLYDVINESMYYEVWPCKGLNVYLLDCIPLISLKINFTFILKPKETCMHGLGIWLCHRDGMRIFCMRGGSVRNEDNEKRVIHNGWFLSKDL